MGLLAAETARPMSAKEIAGTFKVSDAHLSKVLQRLVKAGLLESRRGPGGGFVLAKEPSAVTLLHVYEVTEGPIEPARCLFNLPSCDGRICVLGEVLSEANKKLGDYLTKTTLADVSQVFHHERFQIPEPDADSVPAKE